MLLVLERMEVQGAMVPPQRQATVVLELPPPGQLDQPNLQGGPAVTVSFQYLLTLMLEEVVVQPV